MTVPLYLSGPYYPLGTVPSAYEMSKTYKGMGGRKNAIKNEN
jgi:hypothetical protein